MKVISKYSTLIYGNSELIYKNIAQGNMFIQIEKDNEGGFICELVSKDNIPLYHNEITPVSAPTPFDEPVKSKEEQDLETALATELKNDPQGMYNGCMLEVPFNNQDWEWVDWTLKNMKNKFIRDRVQLIAKAGYAGYGK